MTATATFDVKNDIFEILGIKNSVVCFKTVPNHSNIDYEIRFKEEIKPKKVEQDILETLRKR